MTDLCPLRDKHLDLHHPVLTDAMKRRGLTKITCPCGLQAAVKADPRRN